MLTLQGDDGKPSSLTDSQKQSNALSAAVLSSMQVYEKKNLTHVYACSVKQVKKLVKDPRSQVFAAIVQSVQDPMILESQDVKTAYEFASKCFNDCDELVNNCVRWGDGTVPVVH